MIQMVEGWYRGTKINFRGVFLGPHIAEINTAAAYLDLLNTAEQDGHNIKILSAYRTVDQQAKLAEKLASSGAPVAKPKYSKHHTGTALDLGLGLSFQAFARGESTPAFTWMEKFAHIWGFRRTVKSEPWHWEYLP